MKISGLDLSMPYVSAMIFSGDGWSAVNHIVAQGHVFHGSNLTVPRDPDEGDGIKTGHGDDEVFAGKGDDYIDDFGGRDIYRGGAGRDEVSYNSHRWARPVHRRYRRPARQGLRDRHRRAQGHD